MKIKKAFYIVLLLFVLSIGSAGTVSPVAADDGSCGYNGTNYHVGAWEHFGGKLWQCRSTGGGSAGWFIVQEFQDWESP